jgi:hypothetical protein
MRLQVESLSSALTAATLLLLIGPLTALGVAFVRQAAALLQDLQASYGHIEFTGVASLERVPILGAALRWVEDVAPFSREQTSAALLTAARSLLEWLGSLGGTLFVGAMGTVIGFMLMLFLLFFFCAMAQRCSSDSPTSFRCPDRASATCEYPSGVTRGGVRNPAHRAAARDTGRHQAGGRGLALCGRIRCIGRQHCASPWVARRSSGSATLILAVQGRYGAALFLLFGACCWSHDRHFLSVAHLRSRRVPTLAVSGRARRAGGVRTTIGMFLDRSFLALTIALLRWAGERRALG